MELELVVSYLLKSHACVIIPNLGGFISQRTPSIFDVDKKVFLPPSKKVVFNSKLINNDGLLTDSFAHLNHLSFSEAKERISIEINQWKKQLQDGNRIQIDYFGFLFTDNFGQIRFEQNFAENTLLSSYGLPSISIELAQESTILIEQPVVQTEHELTVPSEKQIEEKILAFTPIVNSDKKIQTAKDNDSPQFKITSPLPKEKRNTSFALTKYAVAFVLVAIIFYSFWIPLKTNFLESHILSISDFNPFAEYKPFNFKSSEISPITNTVEAKKDLKKVLQNKNLEHVYSYEIDGNTFKSIKINKEKVSTSKLSIINKSNLSSKEGINKDNAAKATIYPINNSNFYLIGNCFKDIANANNYIQQMKNIGVNAHIVDNKSGLYRVSIGDANNENELEIITNQLKTKGINNWWILKNK